LSETDDSSQALSVASATAAASATTCHNEYPSLSENDDFSQALLTSSSSSSSVVDGNLKMPAPTPDSLAKKEEEDILLVGDEQQPHVFFKEKNHSHGQTVPPSSLS
jgi:hypothetical protein